MSLSFSPLNLTEADFVDWGNADNYAKAVGW
jgi:hypothetical protein